MEEIHELIIIIIMGVSLVDPYMASHLYCKGTKILRYFSIIFH